MKKFIISFIIIIIILFICMFNYRKDYGVFIGLTSKDIDKIKNYDVLVIDADYFSKEDISKLRNNGNRKIYSYIDIGSIEEYRDYYNDYKDLSLDKYDGFDDEYWVDITNTRWIDLCTKRSKLLIDKGVDGLFIDNIDIYTKYNNDSIYNSIITILNKMNSINSNIIINGGYDFINRYLSSNNKKLFIGINQESVITNYDFNNNKFLLNSSDVVDDYTEYLNKYKALGYDIYVIEYSNDLEINKKIKKYSKKNNWNIYISDNINLK